MLKAMPVDIIMKIGQWIKMHTDGKDEDIMPINLGSLDMPR